MKTIRFVLAFFCALFASSAFAADMLIYSNTVGLCRSLGGVTLNGSHNNSVAIRKPLGLPTRVRYYPNPNSSSFAYCEVYGNALHFACRIMTDENGMMTWQIKPWSGVLTGNSWNMPNGQEYPKFPLPKYGTDTDAVMIWSEPACQSIYHNLDFDPQLGWWYRLNHVVGGQIGILAFRSEMNWIADFTITAGAYELQIRPVALNLVIWNRDVLGL